MAQLKSRPQIKTHLYSRYECTDRRESISHLQLMDRDATERMTEFSVSVIITILFNLPSKVVSGFLNSF